MRIAPGSRSARSGILAVQWVVDVGYAHLFVDEASMSQNDGNAAARGFLLGEQESSVDIVSAQVAYKF